MARISAVRITAPKAEAGEIPRGDLVADILGSRDKITYIHAGAGFGKTTLLSQVACSVNKVVWATLDGESDVFSFLTLLGKPSVTPSRFMSIMLLNICLLNQRIILQLSLLTLLLAASKSWERISRSFLTTFIPSAMRRSSI